MKDGPSIPMLEQNNDGPGSMLADRIAKSSDGNFLYAYLMLRSLRPRLAEIPDLEQFPLTDDYAVCASKV